MDSHFWLAVEPHVWGSGYEFVKFLRGDECAAFEHAEYLQYEKG